MNTFELFWGLEMVFFGEAGKQRLETRGGNSNLLYFTLTRVSRYWKTLVSVLYL